MVEDRAGELARRLAALRERIAAACAAAGRDPEAVTLLAVTKTVPAGDVALLLDLGLTAFGENRVQEADAKVAEVARLRPAAAPRWHFVGGLQRNKARAVVRWADLVESVDSVRLADALDAAVRREQEGGRRDRTAPVLVQYSVDGDPARGGVPGDGLLALADHVAARAGLRLAGLMAWPRWAPTRRRVRRHRRGRGAAARGHPQATAVSAGMSGDLEIAIRHGSRRCVSERPLWGNGR